eukprot:364810-Chlamydomonas_euryale.AAC.19
MAGRPSHLLKRWLDCAQGVLWELEMLHGWAIPRLGCMGSHRIDARVGWHSVMILAQACSSLSR